MANDTEVLPSNGWPVLPLLLTVLLAPAAVFAAPPEIYLGLDSRYSDNIEKAADQKQSDVENTVALRGNYQSDPGKCVASIDGEIAYSVYAEETFDPETRINADALGSCELARGLVWEVGNQTREVTRTRRVNDTPDNRTRKNVFRTGPSYNWRLSSQDVMQLSTRYEQTEFSDPDDADSERFTGSIAWNHLFSSDLSAGLSSSFSDVELDTGAEILTKTVSVTFSKRWATTSISGSIGVSEIETEFQALTRKSDAVVGDLSLTRLLDKDTSVYLRASRELTDQASDFDIRFDEFTFELTETNTLEATSIETGLDKTFTNGDSLSLSAYVNRSDYLDSPEREDRSGVRAGYVRQVTPLLSAVANVRYGYLSFEVDQVDDQVLGMDIGLTYRASRKIELAARVGRNERTSDVATQKFEENWLLIGIDYRFR